MEVDIIMNPLKRHEKNAKDALATYFDEVAERILSNNSKEYQELEQVSSELQEQYHILVEILEYGRFKDNYTRDEIKAVAKYYQTKNFMNDLERMEIYKIGFHSAIKMLSPIEKVLHEDGGDLNES